MENTVFIMGVGRSGTTLLQSMLNAHSKIVFLPESQFIYKYVAPQIKGKDFAITNHEQLLELLQKDEALQRLDLDLKGLVDEVDLNDPKYFAKLFESILEVYSTKTGKPIAGDKYPQYFEIIPEIKEAYPSAKILHIIRDPRDVVLSRKKSGWGAKYPFIVHLLEYKLGLHKAIHDGKKFFAEKYYELQYESLIDNSVAELQNICTFLGVEFEEGMLNYHQKSSEIVKGKEEKSWKENVFKPVMKNNTNKWKQVFTIGQAAMSESLLENELKTLKYETGFASPILTGLLKIPFLVLYEVFKGWKKVKHA